MAQRAKIFPDRTNLDKPLMSCDTCASVRTYIHKCNLKIKERLEGRSKKNRGRGREVEREGGRDRLPYGIIAKTKSFGSNACAW